MWIWDKSNNFFGRITCGQVILMINLKRFLNMAQTQIKKPNSCEETVNMLA